MHNTKIEQIIRLFTGNHFGKATSNKFAWWLTHSSEIEADKEEAIQKLWEESMGEISMRTLTDLQSVHRQMEQQGTKRTIPPLLRHAAAIVALVLLTALGTLLVSDYFKPKEEGFAQLSTSYGESKQIRLEDSTLVTINAGSTLIYPKHFEDNGRNVFLIGEATFEVSHDSHRPFTVETQYMDVTALGTVFDVSAYSDTRTISTTLEEGKTRIRLTDGAADDSRKEYILAPNQNLSYNKVTGEVSITTVDAHRRLSWTAGNLVFEGDDFKTILQTLERRYGVVFVCEHLERMEGCYYVKFRVEETLPDVLYILNNLSHHFSYRIEADTVYISALEK